MKTGPFTLVVAHVLRLDRQSVAVAARNLKARKLMNTGARGVNAPEMTERDLATLLLSLLATDRPAWAADMVERFRGFQLSSDGMGHAVASALPDPDHTLMDFLTKVCGPDLKLEPEHEFVIRVVGQALVEVEGGGWSLVYWPREEVRRDAESLARADPDNLPADLADRLLNGPQSLHGIVTSREVKSTDIELIKRIVFGGERK